MLSTCDTACATAAPDIVKTNEYKIYQRSECGVRFIYAKCGIDFPQGAYDDPALATAFQALVDNGDIGASFELNNWEWQDPTTTTKRFESDCKPADEITTERILSTRSYAATDEKCDATAAPYFDRTFTNTIERNSNIEVRGFVTCSGQVYLFEKDRLFIPNKMRVVTKFDKEVEGKCYEYREYTIRFTNDPLEHRTLPYLDITLASATAGLGWLFA